MAQIDQLDIQITADAKSAVTSLQRLSQSLTNISSALAQVNGTGFGAVTNGIASITQAMNGYANSGVKTADFTRLATQLNKLADVDTAGLTGLSSSIKTLTVATQQVAQIGSANQEMVEFARALSRLGGANITRAVQTIPQLGQAMMQLLKTLSQAPAVSRNVVTLTQALAQLTGNLNGIRQASNNCSTGLRSFASSANSSAKASKGLASAIGKVYATYWMLFRAFSVLGKAVDYASSLTEVQNVVEQTFGKSTQAVNDFAKASKDLLGMSELTTKQIASRYQAMGGAMGIENRQLVQTYKNLANVKEGYVEADASASGMSLTLTKLAGDMASFYDTDQKDVAKDLEAIYTGMTRPLRKYGLDLTQTTLQEYANAKGMNVKVASMTQAEKAMLRYQYVLEHTTSAQGDFLRTADTWANQVKIMKQNFISLGTTIGQVFINAFKPFLKSLNNILVKVQEFAIKIANALGNIFGWTYEGNDVGLLSDTEQEASDLIDDLSGANKEAKKLKATIMGYDELNVMQEPKDKDSGSGSGAGGGLMAELNDNSMGHWVKKYESDISNLFELGQAVGDALIKAMQNIPWNDIYASVGRWFKGLADFLNGLISPELFGETGKMIASALNTALHGLYEFARTFDWENLGLSIATGINEFFARFNFTNLALTINKWVQGIFTTIQTAIQNIKWKDIWNGIENFISAIDDSTILLIVGAWITPKVISTFKSEIIKKITEMFGGSLSATAGGFLLAIEVAFVVKHIITDAKAYKEAMGKDSFLDALIHGDKKDKLKYANSKESNPYNESSKYSQQYKKDVDNLNASLEEFGRLNYWNIEDLMPDPQGFRTYDDYTDAMHRFEDQYKKLHGTGLNATLTLNIAKQLHEFNNETNKWAEDFGSSIEGGLLKIQGAYTTVSNKFKSWQEENRAGRESDKQGFIDYTNEVKAKLSTTFDGAKKSLVDWQNTNKQKREEERVQFAQWSTDVYNKIKQTFDDAGKRIKEWFDNKVKPWFTKERWQQLWDNVKSAFSSKWAEIENWWKNTAISRWWNDHVAPWFSREKWSFSGIREGLETAFNNAVDAVKNVWNGFANWLNDKLTFTMPQKTIGGFTIGGGSINLGRLPTFAKGGFPEDGLFMANHGELVGKFANGNTAVANNEQITAGIRDAVIDGMMQVMMATSDNSTKTGGDVNLYLDGRLIAKSTYDNLKTMGRQGLIPKFI